MKTLEPAPRTFLDPGSGLPRLGAYAGGLPPIDLGAGSWSRLVRRKKWVYVAIASEEVVLSLAVVRMGYATSAFAFLYDRHGKKMIADASVVGAPRAAEIADDPHGAGVLARFAFGTSQVRMESPADAPDRYALGARFSLGAERLELDVEIDASTAPPAIAAIASLGPGLVSATEKRALAPVRGQVVVGGRRFSLTGALGAYDYTSGLMPRHTRWRWALAMGRTKDGSPIAFNVVEGFVGQPECAVFHEGAVHPIAEARVTYDAADPTRPWSLASESMDLTFEPGAVHTQDTNLLLVRSRFLQPVGTFRGKLRAAGKQWELEDVPGVVENQDLLW